MRADPDMPYHHSSPADGRRVGGDHRPVKMLLTPDIAVSVARAEAIRAGRSARTKAFGVNAGLFGEPSWDLMLDLYIAYERGEKINIGRGVAASGVPPTTGLRYIALLTERGLLHRIADPFDRRRHFVSLSETGLAIMRKLMATI